MKLTKRITVLILTAAFLATAASYAAEGKEKKKAKPYGLETCLVSGEKLGNDTYTFTHEGREIKLCCKSCKKDFDKEPAKFVKKLEEAEKKAGKKGKKK